MSEVSSQQDTLMPSPGHDTLNVGVREGTDAKNGTSASLAWGARTDVGMVRSHNEDSFLVHPPLFAVCDGMGGHAAGEVASSIAVETISSHAPQHADDILLGAAVESANIEVIEAVDQGKGKPGMGCTASCVYLENNKMAVAHVGDSRIYLLHAGTLVRLTRDHSYVEELVEEGVITADEARKHPDRSKITRALGSDPDMYADHFSIEVGVGDRIIICSDGLSSMIPDTEIELQAISSVAPQTAADNLVAAALKAGGHDNVTVIVVDVLDDGLHEKHVRYHRRRIISLFALVGALVLAMGVVLALVVNNSWYLGIDGSTVAVYKGIQGDLFGIPLWHLEKTTSVQVSDLPVAVQENLKRGVSVASEKEASDTIENYRDQIDANKTAAALTADRVGTSTQSDQNSNADQTQTGGGQ